MEYTTEEMNERCDEIRNYQGGPAFPLIIKFNDGTNHIFHGMTLRQYYAAKAMAAIIGNMGFALHTSQDLMDFAGKRAFQFADAMLKAEAGDV